VVVFMSSSLHTLFGGRDGRSVRCDQCFGVQIGGVSECFRKLIEHFRMGQTPNSRRDLPSTRHARARIGSPGWQAWQCFALPSRADPARQNHAPTMIVKTRDELRRERARSLRNVLARARHALGGELGIGNDGVLGSRIGRQPPPQHRRVYMFVSTTDLMVFAHKSFI
jgi:hypothetical protein